MRLQLAGPARGRVAATAIVASAACGVLLAGCGAAGPTAGSSTSARMARPAPAAPADQGMAAQGVTSHADTAQGAPGQSRRRAVLPLAAGSDIIYTSTLTVRAHDVAQADAKAQQIVTGVGGYVSNESTSIDPAHPARSAVSLELKIPVSAYPATLSKLASQLGAQVNLQQQAQDVTETVADTRSRVTSAVAAIAQLRTLLSRARSVADLLNIQEQISQQESSLESLQAQQRALDHETAYATVSLRLVSLPAAAAKAKRHHSAGFVRGLTAGWRALRAVGSGLLVVLGALIPFGVLIAAVAYLAYRQRKWLFGRRAKAKPAD